MKRQPLYWAIGSALLTSSLLLVYLHQYEEETSGGARVPLLVAVKPIDRGKAITEEMLGTRDVPIAYVEARAIRTHDRRKILGVPASNALQAQDGLLWSDLAIAPEERDPSSLVQPGNRAISVRAQHDDKGNALIRPGDYVDVISTMPDTHAGDQRSAVVLLQRVLVLAVGLETEAPANGGSPAGRDRMGSRDLLLTLSLNLQEAQLLSLAQEKGTLSVALRNPDDQRVVEGIPDMPSSALLDSKTRLDIEKVRRSGPVRIESTGSLR